MPLGQRLASIFHASVSRHCQRAAVLLLLSGPLIACATSKGWGRAELGIDTGAHHPAPSGRQEIIWSLQTLRFAAAMMVVIWHAAWTTFDLTGSCGSLPLKLYTSGLYGVDIFFVLSGVIITKTSRGLTWREFAWRRFRRIAPLYFFASVLWVTLAGANGAWKAEHGFGWREALANLFLWPATDQTTWPFLLPA
jgi:peptidoglycan/LPS O-acetylase OafA/YrhL